MFTNQIKIIVASVLFALSIYLFIDGSIGNGIFVMFLVGIITLTVFKNEHIIIAFYHLRKNDVDKAAVALDKIKHPDKLVQAQQAYYYFLKGLFEAQKNMNTSEKFFKKALNIGLRTDQDKAVAKLNLAAVALQRRRKREATTLISEVKKLDANNMLDDQVKMLKQQLKRI